MRFIIRESANKGQFIRSDLIFSPIVVLALNLVDSNSNLVAKVIRILKRKYRKNYELI